MIVLGAIPFVIIAVLLVAGTSNAVNLTDGMDGLASGAMVVASLAMMVLCYIAGNEEAARTLMFPHIAGAKELMAVTVEGASALASWYGEYGGELVRVAISRAGPVGGASILRPMFPVTQLRLVKP